jgi:hypothetical protein
MDISRTDGIGGAGRIEGPQRPGRIVPPAGTPGASFADKVDISQKAQLISETLSLPPIRFERLEEVRELIRSGRFDTEARLSGALDRFLAEEL